MIGDVLRYGVILSSVLVVAGLASFVVAPPPGAPGTLQGMLASNFGRPTLDPSSLVRGLEAGDAVSVLQLGALVLLATPVARVSASVVVFLKQDDLMYVGITSLVLAMLLVAIFVVGPTEV